MNNFRTITDPSAGADLKRIVEPLANYICATEKPRTALLSALALLFNEVQTTNRLANTHFRSYLEN